MVRDSEKAVPGSLDMEGADSSESTATTDPEPVETPENSATQEPGETAQPEVDEPEPAADEADDGTEGAAA